MSNFSSNPLAKHFRQPAMYIKLPSAGRWYPDDALDISAAGEVPIYAMTAKDEITMKTPDALMNGSGTVHVIESCCPAIKNPWKMPTVDLDPVLIAIRIATYGKEMEFTSICPHCGTKNEHAVDLSVMLDRVRPADWSKTVNVDELSITLKPQCFEDYNKNNLINFEEQRIIQLVQNQELDDAAKTKEFDILFQRLINTGINQVSKSIATITTSDGTIVADPVYIREFLDNCDKQVWDLIKERLDDIKKNNNFNELTIACSNEECGKEFTTPFVFEQSNFFG
jgi:hypothetical protein